MAVEVDLDFVLTSFCHTSNPFHPQLQQGAWSLWELYVDGPLQQPLLTLPPVPRSTTATHVDFLWSVWLVCLERNWWLSYEAFVDLAARYMAYLFACWCPRESSGLLRLYTIQ